MSDPVLDIEAIRDRLAEVVATAVNSGPNPSNVKGYPNGGDALDTILVVPNPNEQGNYISYHGSSGNPLCHIGLRIELRVGGNEEDSARELDQLLGSRGPSIITALNADPQLGGLVQTIQVVGASLPARYAANEGDGRTWLSSSIALIVHARRSAA